MKKNAPNLAGQKKLTHFFTKKPQDSLLKTGKDDVENKSSKTHTPAKVDGNIQAEHLSACRENNPLKPTANSVPLRRSPRKLTQGSLDEFSPSKNNSKPLKSPVKSKLNGRNKSPKKSPTKKNQDKSPLKQLQILQFSPSPKKTTDTEDTNHKCSTEIKPAVKITPKKRKCLDSPVKEKIPGDQTLSLSSKENKSVNDSIAWGDEFEFVNLCDDSIALSPNKLKVKRQKVEGPFDSNHMSVSRQKKSLAKKNESSEQSLSNYFVGSSSNGDKRSLQFDKLDRYEVVSVVEGNKEILLTVKSLSEDITGTCFVRSPWNECSLSIKDIISIKAVRQEEGWVVDWNGLLVLNPDRLISGTTIVGSVYCTRKSVLSHIFKETGGTKDCMVIGSLVHELFQETLKQHLISKAGIEELCQRKIKSREFLLTLFLNNMNYEETVTQVQSFVGPIYDFMKQYVLDDSANKKPQNWNGKIVQVEDIEENIWSPTLGIKGKVDATVEVKIQKKNKIMPLELKTGKVSFSIEHRGQVILYCMLLQQLGRNVDSGLLLYLNSGVEMKEIKCEERETRDLTLLRNGLSVWISKLFQAEAQELIPPPTLPPPINRRTCSTCPYLVPCSAALRGKELEKLPEGHRLKEFAPEALKHLSDDHMNFVFHWLGLLSLEKTSSTTKLSDIWSTNSELREKSGKCLAQMKMDYCKKDGDGGYKAMFSKIDGSLLETEFTLGQLIIVSTENHLALALAVIKSVSLISLTVLLDKDIKSDQPIFLDAYEGDSTSTILTNNLSCLLEDSPTASRLRELIIDRKIPTFSTKLSSKIKKVGLDIFGRLNKEQVRAVLQAIASENYILIKGMPGAGKTTTMAALIELLTRLKKRVLVTSFTHSAIDNILINLVGKVKMLRLGPEHRVHPKLKEVSEHYYVKNLEDVTPAGIEALFSNKEVVGVTCYGCKHPWIERQMFDVCLVDEASQVTLPGILKPLSLAQKFILIGDPKQLPPLVLNEEAKELGLGKSLFERLERPAVTSPLTIQYRMNSVITSLANDLTYSGELQCANESIAQATLCIPKGLDDKLPSWLKESLSPELDKSVILLDIKSQGNSEVGENKTEASVIIKIIDALIKGGVVEESIGVIATYSRQVALLRTMMKVNAEVNTVDQYQGRDKEIIIFSTTRSSASAAKKDILSDWSRLTVAITRAKTKLIILGSIDVLRSYDNFAKLVSSINSCNIIKVPPDQT